MKIFEIKNNKDININKLREQFYSDEAGGVVIFEGRVRNHNQGKKVTSLEYQAYIEMAEKEGNKILNYAKNNFDIIDAYCVHAEGHLQIGDIAIWIIVTSKHREAAYLANEYIINTVKTTVPIWKREHYINEKPEWIACHKCGKHNH